MLCPPSLTRLATRFTACCGVLSEKKRRVTKYPLFCACLINLTYERVASVVSKANVSPSLRRCIIRSIIRRPAWSATPSGLNGESPAAISSALTNSMQWSISGRTVKLAVVLPAPLHPAIMYRLCFFAAMGYGRAVGNKFTTGWMKVQILLSINLNRWLVIRCLEGRGAGVLFVRVIVGVPILLFWHRVRIVVLGERPIRGRLPGVCRRVLRGGCLEMSRRGRFVRRR